MVEDTLNQAIARVAAAPRSVTGLTLYALVSTLEQERAGCLFKLVKLRDLPPEDRRIAYGLMEMLAEGRNRGPAWAVARSRLDELVRGG
jgi:hypothetical protein